MGIGASVFLIAVGGILAFAVRDATIGGWLELNTAGWVLMIVGGIGLIVALIIWGSRRQSTTVEQPTRRRVVDDDTY